MKYKIGDRVRIICNSHGHEFTTGDIVEIEDIENDPVTPYFARSIETGQSWYLNKNEIESVSEYPKEMWVWDKNTVDPVVREVVAYAPEIEFPYLTKDKNKSNWKYIGYKYAKDLPQPKELTMQEIADKFGINIEQLKIKK